MSKVLSLEDSSLLLLENGGYLLLQEESISDSADAGILKLLRDVPRHSGIVNPDGIVKKIDKPEGILNNKDIPVSL